MLGCVTLHEPTKTENYIINLLKIFAAYSNVVKATQIGVLCMYFICVCHSVCFIQIHNNFRTDRFSFSVHQFGGSSFMAQKKSTTVKQWKIKEKHKNVEGRMSYQRRKGIKMNMYRLLPMYVHGVSIFYSSHRYNSRYKHKVFTLTRTHLMFESVYTQELNFLYQVKAKNLITIDKGNWHDDSSLENKGIFVYKM